MPEMKRDTGQRGSSRNNIRVGGLRLHGGFGSKRAPRHFSIPSERSYSALCYQRLACLNFSVFAKIAKFKVAQYIHKFASNRVRARKQFCFARNKATLRASDEELHLAMDIRGMRGIAARSASGCLKPDLVQRRA